MFIIERKSGEKIAFIDEDDIGILNENYVLIKNTGEIIEEKAKEKDKAKKEG